jgi:UDP-N-acetylmuramoyl-tripeptide--D-alanyl-D-alanine ligase
MTFQVTLTQLLSLLDATPFHLTEQKIHQSAMGVNTDTRNLRPGELFVALRGDSFDGHRFVEPAIAAGAIAAVVEQPIATPVPQLVVGNTLYAYQQLGRWWREQFTVPVIAITGSVGKTTTKEMVAAALETVGPTLKTEANYNNEIGVPKTLLNLTANHRFAVIEMGMRGPGEIAELAKIAKPDIGVITNVGTAHIGRLGSREAIAQAKCELLSHMSTSSLAILNAENPLLLETAQSVWSGKTITYGLSTGDLRGTVIDEGTLLVDGIRYPLPLPGEHNALNLLAVIAILRSLGINDQLLQRGLTVNLPTGRAQRYTLPNDIVLLDETYNAGVESMVAALKLLAQTPGTRKIAVLGPMKELGDYTEALHQEVGQQVTALKVDALYILDTGPEGTAIAQGAGSTPTQQFATHAALVSQLLKDMQAGDRLLFKASHAIGLDRVVNELRDRLEI